MAIRDGLVRSVCTISGVDSIPHSISGVRLCAQPDSNPLFAESAEKDVRKKCVVITPLNVSCLRASASLTLRRAFVTPSKDPFTRVTAGSQRVLLALAGKHDTFTALAADVARPTLCRALSFANRPLGGGIRAFVTV